MDSELQGITDTHCLPSVGGEEIKAGRSHQTDLDTGRGDSAFRRLGREAGVQADCTGPPENTHWAGRAGGRG